MNAARADLLLAAALLLGSAAPGCKANTVSNDTTNTSTGYANVIGAAGGVVLGPDGTSVRVAAGALTKDTRISIRVSEPSEYPALPGDVNLLTKVYAFEPHGLAFASPAVVTLPFGGAGGSDVVAIRAEGTKAATWQKMPVQVATDAQISTPGFSFYAIARGATGSTAGGPTDTSCPTGQIVCNGTCTNTTSDPNNCGGCGVPCAAPATCQNSTCSSGGK